MPICRATALLISRLDMLIRSSKEAAFTWISRGLTGAHSSRMTGRLFLDSRSAAVSGGIRLFLPKTAWEESHVLIQDISPCGIRMPLMDCYTAEAIMILDARRRQFLTICPTLAQDLGLLIDLRRMGRPVYVGVQVTTTNRPIR